MNVRFCNIYGSLLVEPLFKESGAITVAETVHWQVKAL